VKTETSHRDISQSFFPVKGFARFLLLVCLFAAALGVRVYHIGDPPLNFHPTRQYRSAFLARAIYFEQSHSVTEDERQLAQANKPAILEPPLMEYMASWLYQISGKENLVIPRLMSIVFWLLAAAFLYVLSECSLSPDAAITSTAFFLFLPFGIYASRSFQPDPLMVMVFLAAVLAIFKYRQDSSTYMLAAAIALSALAIFIKPVCVFPIWLVFISTSVTENGVRATLRSAGILIFLSLSILPALLFYGYGLFVAGFWKNQVQVHGTFLPHLFLEGFYWQGWLRLIFNVIGFGALIAALLGIPLVRQRLTKGLLVGLWGGYVVFGLFFTYAIHTHDYYHLMLIPIVALSLGATIGVILSAVSSTARFWRWTAWGILLFVLALYMSAVSKNLGSSGFESQVAIWEDIGDRVSHSTNTVILARHYGKPLKYHGKVAGSNWPHHDDFRAATLMRTRMERGKQRLDSLISSRSPEYFIVTDLAALDNQQDLKKALGVYPILFLHKKYRIYDLRKSETPK
jgi:hypothetical protein